MIHDEHMNPVEDSASQGAKPRPRLVSRRALVRAGWTVPVVLALEMLPVKVFASPGCTVHSDIAGAAHVDLGVPPDHLDTPASAHSDTCV